MDTKLKVINLCKKIGKKQLLNDISFSIHKGEIIGFLGHNGAGKSTTIKIIAGLVTPSSGTVEIDNTRVSKRSPEGLKKLGIMFEAPMFYNFMTGRKNMQILNRYAGRKNDYISEVLKIVGLSNAADVKVGEYSQGMRQRLGIAQALVAKPELLILDEPTNALDPSGRKEMKDLIQKLAFEDQITIFLSSHLLTEIEQVCTRVIIINKGKIIASKEMTELREEGVTSLENYFLELTERKN